MLILNNLEVQDKYFLMYKNKLNKLFSRKIIIGKMQLYHHVRLKKMHIHQYIRLKNMRETHDISLKNLQNIF